ncbi:MAG: PQQ-binding-like beta-propeller repeat protein [Christensenellales bacterium]
MNKRIVSFLIAICMLLMLMPGLTALAEATMSITLRIEGISETLYYETRDIPYAGTLTVQQALVYLDSQEDSLTIVGADSGYVTAVNGEAAGTFGGFDGWMYQVNGAEATTGIDAAYLNAGDTILLYYGDPFNVGMQFPQVDASRLNSDGILKFTSQDTTYDSEWNPTVTTNPIVGATVTWYDTAGDVCATYVTDANGEVVIEQPCLTVGSHRIQIEKYEETAGQQLPVVARLASDFYVVVGDADGEEISAWWPYSRRSSDNMAIVGVKTPKSADEADLLWSSFVGSSDWSRTPGEQIMVDDALFVVSGSTLFKLDKETGATIATGSLASSNFYSNTSPIFAEGMIIVALKDGVVQALDAKTLVSLWVYTDSLGGQGQTPLTYSDGFVYTGFWNSTGDANYVCIDVGTGQAEWTHTAAGGFYWAGSVSIGDCVVFGSEEGIVYSLNKQTGAVEDTFEVEGSVRSSIACEGGHIYFTSGTRLYGIEMDGSSFGSAASFALGGSSTSTPVVYKGRIYVGVEGSDETPASVVVVESGTMAKIYAVPMAAYPQNSLLLSTAYEASTGKVYLYSTYNDFPGGITVIEDSAGQTEAVYAELFAPAEAERNYCICSIICGEDGTLYYKNDSGHIFAIARAAAPAVGDDLDDVPKTGDVGLDSVPFLLLALGAVLIAVAAVRVYGRVRSGR